MVCGGRWPVEGDGLWREMVCEGRWCVEGDVGYHPGNATQYHTKLRRLDKHLLLSTLL